MAISFVNSTTGSAINGGNVTLTLPGAYKPGDVAYVAITLATTKATALSVASSSGGAYSQVVSTITSSNARFGVFRQVIPSTAGLTQAVITGTGGSTDATSGVVHIFRGVEISSPEDVAATSTTGFSSIPDSPSITVVSCSAAILTSVGCQTVNTITAPTSFLDAATVLGNDTYDARTGQAWIINASTSAFNPGPWTNTVGTFAWCAATIALEPSLTWGSILGGPDVASPLMDEMRRVTIKSYF